MFLINNVKCKVVLQRGYFLPLNPIFLFLFTLYIWRKEKRLEHYVQSLRPNELLRHKEEKPVGRFDI